MFNEAVNAAGEYIGNAIQEILVVKKEAEHPRVLPSLQHMKIVSNFCLEFWWWAKISITVFLWFRRFNCKRSTRL